MTSSSISPRLIIEPAPGAEAPVSGSMGQGMLLHASGNTVGSQIAEIKALCEPISGSSGEGTKTPAQVKAAGKSAYRNGSSWTVSYVPGAKYATGAAEQWNMLHVCTFYYGYPNPVPPFPEKQRFRGIDGSSFAIPQSLADQSLDAALQSGGHSIAGTVSRLADLVDTWWDRDVNFATSRQPDVRDGDWLLYRDLPVDMPFGIVLGLDGNALRARSISVAVEQVAIRRKLAPPIVHLAAPQGEGLPAVNEAEITWRFPGYPRFGTVIHQAQSVQHAAITQPIHSSCRDCPTHMFLDPLRTIRIAVNSPEFEDFLNEGRIDLWIRVNPF